MHTSGVLIEFHPLVAQSQESNQGFSVFQSLECSSLQMVPLRNLSTATAAWAGEGALTVPSAALRFFNREVLSLSLALFRDTVDLWFRFKVTI